MDIVCTYLGEACVVSTVEDETVGGLKRKAVAALSGRDTFASSTSSSSASVSDHTTPPAHHLAVCVSEDSSTYLDNSALLRHTSLNASAGICLVPAPTVIAPHRYNGEYSAMALGLPDGDATETAHYLALGGNSSVALWNARTTLCVWEGGASERGFCTALGFSEDAASLVAGWGAGRVVVYETATGAVLRALQVYTAVRSVCFSGGKIMAGGGSNIVHVWGDDSSVPALFTGHSASVSQITPGRSDAVFLLSASVDTTVRVWDADGASFALLGHRDWVSDVAAHPCGTMAVSAGADGTVRVWDLLQRVCVRVLVGHGQGVFCVALVAGRWCLSCSPSEVLVRDVFDVSGGEEEGALCVDLSQVCAATVQEGEEGGVATPTGWYGAAVTHCGGWTALRSGKGVVTVPVVPASLCEP